MKTEKKPYFYRLFFTIQIITSLLVELYLLIKDIFSYKVVSFTKRRILSPSLNFIKNCFIHELQTFINVEVEILQSSNNLQKQLNVKKFN